MSYWKYQKMESNWNGLLCIMMLIMALLSAIIGDFGVAMLWVLCMAFLSTDNLQSGSIRLLKETINLQHEFIEVMERHIKMLQEQLTLTGTLKELTPIPNEIIDEILGEESPDELSKESIE